MAILGVLLFGLLQVPNIDRKINAGLFYAFSDIWPFICWVGLFSVRL